MKLASSFLVGVLVLGGSTFAQASVERASPAGVQAPVQAFRVLLARNGADNAPGDDHGGGRAGGQGGKGRGGHDDGGNHH